MSLIRMFEAGELGAVGAGMTGGTRVCSGGHEVENDSLFCPRCGVALEWQCENGHRLDEGQAFCPRCGAPASGTSAHAARGGAAGAAVPVPVPVELATTPAGSGGVGGGGEGWAIGERWAIVLGTGGGLVGPGRGGPVFSQGNSAPGGS